MSTETRDALRKALDGIVPFLSHWPTCIVWRDDTSACDCGLNDAKGAVLAALRATDVPVAEGLRECPHCGRSLDPRPYDANRDEPTALATPEPDA